MDSQTIKLITRLRSGPYDATALSRIREELTTVRDQLAAKRETKILANLAQMLEAWARSTADRTAASLAIYEAAQIAELDLKEEERAAQLYGVSMELDPFNKASLVRLEPLMRRLRQFPQLENMYNFQIKTLTDAGAAGSSEHIQMLRSLAKLRAEEIGNVDGAIDAYEAALDIEPDVSDVKALASLYVSRRKKGDAERAADLYYTLGDILEDPDRIPMLEKALDLVPNHEGALSLLETVAASGEQAGRLKDRWVAFLERVPSGPVADARRVSLARAYAVEGRHEEALSLITDQVKNGDEAAAKVFVEIRSKMNLAEQTGGAGEPARVIGARAAVRVKKTLVGYKVPDLVDQAPPAAGNEPLPSLPEAPPAAGSMPQMPAVPPPKPLGPPPPPPPPEPPRMPEIEFIQPTSQAVPAPPAVAAPLAAEVRERPPSLDREIEMDDETALRKKFPTKWLVAGAVLVVGIGTAVAFGPKVQKLSGFPKLGGFAKLFGATTTPAEQKPGGAARTPAPEPPKPPKPPEPATPTPAPAPTAPATSPAAAQKPPKATDAGTKAKGSGLMVQLLTEKAKYRSGKLDKDQFIQTLEEKIPDLEKCYSRALKRKPKTKGELSYSWTIGKDGKVGGVKKLRGSTISNTTMISCVTTVIRKIRFPKPKRAPAAVQMPIAFSRSE